MVVREHVRWVTQAKTRGADNWDSEYQHKVIQLNSRIKIKRNMRNNKTTTYNA